MIFFSFDSNRGVNWCFLKFVDIQIFFENVNGASVFIETVIKLLLCLYYKSIFLYLERKVLCVKKFFENIIEKI